MVTAVLLTVSLMMGGVHGGTNNEICEVQLIHRTATNTYDPLGNILKRGHTELGVLTLRGKMLPARRELKDGIEVASYFAGQPFLRIFIKDTKQRMNMEKHVDHVLETVVAIRDSRKGYKNYYKVLWDTVSYSFSRTLVYQITANATGFNIRINRSYRFIPYPGGFLGPLPFVYVAQIGRITVFKEVSWCPRQPRAIITPGINPQDGLKSGSSWGYYQGFSSTHVSLTCRAEGPPPLRIVWVYKDHTISPSDKAYGVVDGITTEFSTFARSTLNFTMDTTIEGWYRCTVVTSGLLFPPLSETSYMEVQAIIPLTIEIVEPRYKVISEGQDAIFTCNIEEWRGGASTALAWHDLAHTPLRSYKTSTLVLSPTKRQALLIFRKAQLEDSGIFRCGREVASLFVTAPIHRVEVDIKKIHDKVYITCWSRANPRPRLHVHVTQNEYHVMDPVILMKYGSSQTRYNISETFLLDTSLRYTRIRFECRAEQVQVNGTVMTVVSRGKHVMPQNPTYTPPKCRVTMVTQAGNVTWVGGYTSRLQDPQSGVQDSNCTGIMDNHVRPPGKVSLTVPRTNLVYGNNLELRCQLLTYPGFSFLYLVKDWTRVIRMLEIQRDFVRPYVEVEIQRVQEKDDGEYSCLATNREFNPGRTGDKEEEAWESKKIMVYRKGVVSLESPDFLSTTSTSNVYGPSLPQHTVLNGSHVLLKCTVSGHPAPRRAFLELNQVTVAKATKPSATSIEVRAFVPVNKTSEVVCYAYQSRFNKDKHLALRAVVVPITVQLHARFWDTWSPTRVLFVFGVISFTSLALLTVCWLGAAALTRVTATHTWNATRGSATTPSPALKPREQFARIKNVLTQLIEQPFLESYTFIRNSIRVSTIPTSTASPTVEVLDPRSFGELEEGGGEGEGWERSTDYDDVAVSDDFIDTTDDNLDDGDGDPGTHTGVPLLHMAPTSCITVQVDTHPNMDMGAYHREKDLMVKDMDIGKRKGVIFNSEGQEDSTQGTSKTSSHEMNDVYL